MNKTILGVLAVAVVIAIGGYMSSQSKTPQPFGAVSGPDIYSFFNVHGPLTHGGDVRTVTPVSATYTLTAADLVESNVIRFTASSTMPALTVTLPASTTLPLLIEPGATRTWTIENSFTAAATTTTVAATTGVDLQEPDGQNVVIGINNYAWITCFRELSTDIVCLVDESIPAD